MDAVKDLGVARGELFGCFLKCLLVDVEYGMENSNGPVPCLLGRVQDQKRFDYCHAATIDTLSAAKFSVASQPGSALPPKHGHLSLCILSSYHRVWTIIDRTELTRL